MNSVTGSAPSTATGASQVNPGFVDQNSLGK